MQRHFDEELNGLSTDIIKMATLSREAIISSIDALKNMDKVRAQKVISDDEMVDDLELQVDEKCIDLIARFQPMAKDLRFIATGMKINADIERIADLAVDIAQRVVLLCDLPQLKPIIDIPKLADVAQNMVREATESFTKRDVAMARKVIDTDNEADDLRNRISNELVNDYMSKDPSTATRAVPLLLIARHLERICDHASSIAEDIIYMVEGKTIKHHHTK